MATAEQQREWRKRNPNYEKEWRARNPDYEKNRRKADPEYRKRKNAEHAAWLERNPDYLLKWASNNRDYKRANQNKNRRNKPINAMFNAARDRARKKKIQFELTILDIELMLKECNHKCHYSGVTMTLDTGNGTGNQSPTKVSIDRIDNNRGYTRDNVVLCCTQINFMKRTMTVAEFKDWCRLVTAVV